MDLRTFPYFKGDNVLCHVQGVSRHVNVLTMGVFVTIWFYWLPKVLCSLHKLIYLTQLFL